MPVFKMKPAPNGEGGGSGSGATYSIEKLQDVIPTKLNSMGVTQVGSNVYLFGGFSLTEQGDINEITKFSVTF